MQSMSFASTARKVTAFAAAAATLLALGACGNSNNGSAGNNGAKSTSEPQEGVPTNYTGSFPMPDPGKAYNNPKDRGELKRVAPSPCRSPRSARTGTPLTSTATPCT